MIVPYIIYEMKERKYKAYNPMHSTHMRKEISTSVTLML